MFTYLLTYIHIYIARQPRWQDGSNPDNEYSYVAPPYCRAEMYAGRVACCPLKSHGEYADGTDSRTDGRMPDRYITLSARCRQRNKLERYWSLLVRSILVRRTLRTANISLGSSYAPKNLSATGSCYY